jgi:hypothetical protein
MSDHGSEGGHAMAMYFTTERPPRLVFESWSIEQDLDYNLACVILFALSAFSLWLRVYRGNSEARLHGARSNGYASGLKTLPSSVTVFLCTPILRSGS